MERPLNDPVAPDFTSKTWLIIALQHFRLVEYICTASLYNFLEWKLVSPITSITHLTWTVKDAQRAPSDTTRA